jgi:hypothetical protein
VLVELLILASLLGVLAYLRPWTTEGVRKLRWTTPSQGPLALKDGLSRASFPTVVGMIVGIVGLLIGRLGERSALPWGPTTTATIEKGAAGVMLFTVFGVVLPIVLFNRPRFLVPKGFRHEPGLVMAWAMAVVRAARWLRSSFRR